MTADDINFGLVENYAYDDKKIVVVLSNDIEAGVAMNVTGHLSVSLGAYGGTDLMGRPSLFDASGVPHRGIAKYPLIIAKTNQGKLRTLIVSARFDNELFIADYPAAMLETGHDDDLASEMSNIFEKDIRYLGVLLFGDTDKVTALTRKFSLWR